MSTNPDADWFGVEGRVDEDDVDFDDVDPFESVGDVSLDGLTADEQNRARYQGRFDPEARLFERTDRIVTGRVGITVKSVNTGYPGSTDCKSSIEMDFGRIKADAKSPEMFMGLAKGVNYHELAHIEHGIISNEALQKACDAQTQGNSLFFSDIKFAENVLSDQRDETLFAARYPKAADYFTMTVANMVVKNSEKSSDPLLAFALTNGRYYLPDGLRAATEKAAREVVGDAVVDRVKSITRTYVFSSNPDEMVTLAVELAKIFAQKHTQQPQGITQNNRKGEPGAGELREAAKDAEVAQESFGEEAAKEFGKGDAESKAAGDSVSAQSKAAQSQEAVEAVKSAAEAALESAAEAVREEVLDALAEVESERASGDFLSDVGFTKTNAHEMQKNAIKGLIRKLRIDLQNSYAREKSSGRLDVRRVINTKGLSAKVFRRYQENRMGKGKLAVTIMLDSSSSMEGANFSAVRDSAWVVANALTETGDDVEVYEWSSPGEFRVMKPFGRSGGDWGRRFYGNTDPMKALQKSRSGLKARERTVANRVAFLFTDGAFNGGGGQWDAKTNSRRDVREEMQRLVDDGVLLVGVFPESMKYAKEHYVDPYPYSETHFIDKFEDMKKVMIAVIARIQREAARR